MVGVAHAVDDQRFTRLRTRGVGSHGRLSRGVRARDGLHGDLARSIPDGDGGRHRAALYVHHRDVVGAFVRHKSEATIGARRAPVCGAFPTRTAPASVLFAVLRVLSSPGPWTTASAHRPSGVNGA